MIDRTLHAGFCGQTNELCVARAALHYWEEPCISGVNGSGAVFFSGCNMKCIFCQNHDISALSYGKHISISQLADVFLTLQSQNAANINLVTPTHFIPSIYESLIIAKKKGLTIPVVYNSSGYEDLHSLRMLDGLIDIYLPDLKYVSRELSGTYSGANDYFDIASAALSEMYRQVKSPMFDKDQVPDSYDGAMMKRGMIVRHLVLPGSVEDSKKVLDYLYHTFQDSIYISIMCQYTPLDSVANCPPLNRRISHREYDSIVEYASNLGITNAFIQDWECADESFIPPFDLEGVRDY